MAPCDHRSQFGCTSSFRCQCKVSLPREFALTAKLPAKAGTPQSGDTRRVNTGRVKEPVAAFVLVSRLGTTQATNERLTALQDRSRLPPFYLRHTPTLRGFNHSDDESEHRAPPRLPQRFPGYQWPSPASSRR